MQTMPMDQVLRHRAPMIFLDDVVAADKDNFQASIRIRAGIPFFEAGVGVPAWVGLEYMAQAIAALAGTRAHAAGIDMPLGLLIGCRQFKCGVTAFAPGLKLIVFVRELAAEENGFASFDCEIRAADDEAGPIAQARVTVFGGDRQEQV